MNRCLRSTGHAQALGAPAANGPSLFGQHLRPPVERRHLGPQAPCTPCRGPASPIASERSRPHVATAATADTQSVASTSTSSTTSPVVTIQVPYRVEFGETIKLVGSGRLFGDWNADEGLQLEWSEGDVWKASVPFGAGQHEFKCVVYNLNTRAVTRWEDGPNRSLSIPEEPGTWAIDCQWGATQDMTQAFTPAPAPPPPPPPPAAVEPAPAPAAVKEPAKAAAPPSSEEQATFMALDDTQAKADVASSNGTGRQIEDVSSSPTGAPAAYANGTGASSADAEAADSGSGSNTGSGAGIALALAASLAGVVAAVAVLTPGGFDASSLSSLRSAASTALNSTSSALNTTVLQSQLAGAQVQAQVATQMAALQGSLSAAQEQLAELQPAVQSQVASLQGSLASTLQPMVDSGVAYVQSTAEALGDSVADAADMVRDLQGERSG